MSSTDGGTPEAIALAIAWHIENGEKDMPDRQTERRTDPRRYFLHLYGECLAATKGKKPKPDPRGGAE